MMSTEEEWMLAEGFHYVEDSVAVDEVEYEYWEEDYIPLDNMFKKAQFPSMDDWEYYTNEFWD